MVMKKIIPVIMCFILALSICVSATETTTPAAEENASAAMEEMPRGGGRMGGRGPGGGGGQPPQMPNGEMPQMPEEMTPTEMPNGEMPQPPEMAEGAADGTRENMADNAPADSANNDDGTTEDSRGGFGGGMIMGETQETEDMTIQSESTGIIGFMKEYSTPIISVILLAFAFVFVIFYKRRNY